MTVLKIFALEDTKEEDAVSSLPEGEHIIGRGVTLNCNDKRISRKHALINVLKDIVTIKAVHVNPCFFKAANGNSITILPKDTTVELNNGDQFALLADQFWFRVRLITDGNCSNLDTGANIITSSSKSEKIEKLNVSTDSTNLSSNSKRCLEENLTEPYKRQKVDAGNKNEKPSTSTSPDKNISQNRPTSPISLDLLLDTSPNLKQNIDSNQLINNLNDIFVEDYGVETSEGQKQKVFNEDEVTDSKETNSTHKNKNVSQNDKNLSNLGAEGERKEADTMSDEYKSIDNLNINGLSQSSVQEKNEKADKTEVKKEILSDSQGEDITKKTVKQEINEGTSSTLVQNIKKEEVEDTSQSKKSENKDTEHKNDQNEASCSKDNPNKEDKKKSRRERCWYAHVCYRKNPLHRENFSHPGDDDFLSDPDDDRPVCPFGDTCYRTNLLHRRDYKHANRPAPKPNGGGQPKRKRPKKTPTSDNDSEDGQNDDGTRKKRKAAAKKMYKDDSYDDDYDLNDPFIDDASSDEFQPSSDDEAEDSTDWDDSQKVNEESQETRRLLKEAKRFTKAKQQKKD